ncbi:hypothetical protein V502_01930 [Pseudogymnoascus sp. VKM F-4520 (FW-2644)]|nr:hypothetical protein V502_01930 [Pseudogymnoascus sp. VKM F-4520 (FW-2644)]
MSAPLFTIRIAMLNTDRPVPKVFEKRGSYGSIFYNPLKAAAAAEFGYLVEIDAQDFDVVNGDYPKAASDFNAIFVTGAAAASYDDFDWIRNLADYILEVYETYPQVKIFGSCFGHQIVCDSLLRKHDVHVEKDPNGWELGVREIELNREFCKAFEAAETILDLSSSSTSHLPTLNIASKPSAFVFASDSLRLQLLHSDHVKLQNPDCLPGSWVVIGRSKHCAVQGVYEPSRVLTFQGHFEYDRFIVSETVQVVGATWEPNFARIAQNNINKEDDADIACRIVLKFLLQKHQVEEEPEYY